jgi:hypothetical protein
LNTVIRLASSTNYEGHNYLFSFILILLSEVEGFSSVPTSRTLWVCCFLTGTSRTSQQCNATSDVKAVPYWWQRSKSSIRSSYETYKDNYILLTKWRFYVRMWWVWNKSTYSCKHCCQIVGSEVLVCLQGCKAV